MMHLWTIKEICEESSGAPAVEAACLEYLYQLVGMDVIDLDVAAAATEVSVEELKMRMKERGYTFSTSADSAEQGASVQERGACRMMLYLLMTYMINRELEDEQKDM